ncbi:MAG: hypothetical protein QME64_05885 [bacterium]|nr:hypothetical protein [bacterium]
METKLNLLTITLACLVFGLTALLIPSQVSAVSLPYTYGFETGWGDWTGDVNSVGMVLTSDQNHTLGGAICAYTFNTGLQGSYTLSFTDSTVLHLVGWFYDQDVIGGDTTFANYLFFRHRTLTDGYYYIGIASASGTPDQYIGGVYRKTPSSWIYYPTGVTRTVGWHRMQIILAPFSGSNDPTFKIDNTAVTASRITSLSAGTLYIGRRTNPVGNRAYFDDITLGLPGAMPPPIVMPSVASVNPGQNKSFSATGGVPFLNGINEYYIWSSSDTTIGYFADSTNGIFNAVDTGSVTLTAIDEVGGIGNATVLVTPTQAGLVTEVEPVYIHQTKRLWEIME